MTGRLDITAPTTITVLAGSGTLSSLDALPPGGISITDADTTGRLSVELVAGHGTLLATASGGATAGNLTIYDTLGSVVSTFGIGLASGQPGVSIVSDGAGGSLITLADELPCFARGTRLLTPNGYRAVESLKPGDPLVTATGDKRPVRWIGRRTLDLGPGTARFALPVLIMPGAFGPGLPLRPLRLSPLHCVYADGVLIPATHLVNGAPIPRAAGLCANGDQRRAAGRNAPAAAWHRAGGGVLADLLAAFARGGGRPKRDAGHPHRGALAHGAVCFRG